MLTIKNDVRLKELTTFGIGGNARYFAEVAALDDLRDALAFAAEERLELLILGGGSNMLVSDRGFAGLTLKIGLKGFEVIAEDAESVLLRVAAGEIWDEVVANAVEAGWWGVENLSLIPGSAGAFAVQNVGAYGQEASDVVESLDVREIAAGAQVSIPRYACGFGYRASVFNTQRKGRDIILNTVMRLKKRGTPNLSYRDLAAYFQGKPTPTLPEMRAAVIAIRDAKLPDPKNIGSAGSFFKNLTLDLAAFRKMRDQIGRALGEQAASAVASACRENAAGVKVPTALLLDLCGLKGKRVGGAEIFHKHPLILINADGSATADDVMRLMQCARQTVYAHAGVEIFPEPNLIGFSPEELREYFAVC